MKPSSASGFSAAPQAGRGASSSPSGAAAPPTSRQAAPLPTLAIPELHALQELRIVLARGGRPPLDKRTPEDFARLATHTVVDRLLAMLRRYKLRIELGERCRLVVKELASEPGRLAIEIVIEADGSKGSG